MKGSQQGFLLFVPIVAAILLMCGCEGKVVSNDNQHAFPVYVIQESDNQYGVELESSIGVLIDSTGQYMFGNIADISTAENGDLLVLDISFRTISRYDHSFKFKESFVLPLGEGPGEFIRPNAFAYLSGSNRFVIKDRDAMEITLLDSEGRHIESQYVPSPFYALSPMGPHSFAQAMNSIGINENDNLINVWSDDLTSVAGYGSRQRDYQQLFDMGLRGGINDVFIADLNNEYFVVAFGYPYEIQVWRKSGSIERIIKRELAGFDQIVERGGLMLPGGKISCLAARDEETIVTTVYNTQTGQTDLHIIDIYGYKKGSFSLENINLMDVPPYTSCDFTNNGRLILESIPDYPVLNVLRIELAERLEEQ